MEKLWSSQLCDLVILFSLIQSSEDVWNYLHKIIIISYLWATTIHLVYAIPSDFICVSAWHFCKLAECVLYPQRGGT